MRVREYLREDFVLAPLRARDAESVVHELSACAEAAGIAPERLVADGLWERECSCPTNVGSGIAIPHATVAGLTAPVLGIAIADEPLPFGAPDQEPVEVFFVLLSPPGSESLHVKLLARICRLIRHTGLVDQLHGADDGEAVVRVVEDIDAAHV